MSVITEDQPIILIYISQVLTLTWFTQNKNIRCLSDLTSPPESSWIYWHLFMWNKCIVYVKISVCQVTFKCYTTNHTHSHFLSDNISVQQHYYTNARSRYSPTTCIIYLSYLTAVTSIFLNGPLRLTRDEEKSMNIKTIDDDDDMNFALTFVESMVLRQLKMWWSSEGPDWRCERYWAQRAARVSRLFNCATKHTLVKNKHTRLPSKTAHNMQKIHFTQFHSVAKETFECDSACLCFIFITPFKRKLGLIKNDLILVCDGMLR